MLWRADVILTFDIYIYSSETEWAKNVEVVNLVTLFKVSRLVKVQSFLNQGGRMESKGSPAKTALLPP